MSLSFKKSDTTVTEGMRRIALSQIDAGISVLRDGGGDLHTRIHDGRKRAKKLRGLLRLVRPAFPDYAEENRALRDAARILSEARDLTAFIATYDALTARHATTLDLRRTAPVRAELTCDRDAASAEELSDRLAAMADALEGIRARIPDWTLKDDGFEAVGGGLSKTYGRARKAMVRARRTRKSVDLHDWRKRVKYHGYHTRMLRRAWPVKLKAHLKATADLGELLGDHHDLVAFEHRLSLCGANAETRTTLRSLARADRRRLGDAALAQGAFLLAEKPGPLINRWCAWWSVWRRS